MQRLVLLRLHGVVLPLQAQVGGHRVLNVALAGVPGLEGRAGGERVGVGLGDLGLGDLRGVDGDGQGRMDVRWRQKGLVLGVEVDRLESGRRLAVGVIYHGVALVVISCRGIWRDIGKQMET